MTQTLPIPTSSTSEIRLELPHFSGNLLEVAQALRSGVLSPSDVPLCELVEKSLEHFQALRALDNHTSSEALPLMASVVSWKVKMLLPSRQEPVQDYSLEIESEDLWDELATGIKQMADLERLVTFLSSQRRGREWIVASKPLELNLPRREQAQSEKLRLKGLSRLLEAARSAVRDVRLEGLSRERLTLEGAYRALKAFSSRLRRFLFSSVTVSSWSECTVYFTALLEGVREGVWTAHQGEVYGEIELEALEEAMSERSEL